jgi:hypothetical protein
LKVCSVIFAVPKRLITIFASCNCNS